MIVSFSPVLPNVLFCMSPGVEGAVPALLADSANPAAVEEERNVLRLI
jgi:hypothetical protein